jgi:hypothetical protein
MWVYSLKVNIRTFRIAQTPDGTAGHAAARPAPWYGSGLCAAMFEEQTAQNRLQDHRTDWGG